MNTTANRKGKAILLVIIAALALEITGLVQFFFSQKIVSEQANMRVANQLEIIKVEILDVIDQAETAVRNNAWIAQWSLNHLDSLERVCSRLVIDNPVTVGSTVALVPGYKKDRPLFSPYAYKNKNDSLLVLSLATSEYNYPAQEWFTKPLELERDYWSEPYIDVGGGEMLMTTYSIPIRDEEGIVAAVLTADISLEWLTSLIGSINMYPNAKFVLLSRNGHQLVSTAENKSLETEKCISFEASVERNGWSMSLIVPEDDIYADLHHAGTIVMFLQLLGLALIILIMRSFIRGLLRFRELDQQRQRIEGELRIATGIQMSMVPRIFPAFPERHDLDMAATILPAKEVGGDLYDFFIRDEKLFFCVGDVSGKGVPAALVMAVTRTTFRNMSAQEDSPGRIVKTMNDGLCVMNNNDMFVTFFCGVLDLKNGILRYCNAGHNPPRILTDAIRPLPVEPNIPLGIIVGMEFQEQETPFRFDDALFLYTDGLTEAENASQQQFGEERMDAALHGKKSANSHLENMKEKVSAFVGDAPQSDDLTMFFIHYTPSDLSLTLRNNIDQIALLPPFVEETVKMSKLDPDLTDSLNLALEEVVANVIFYAYPHGETGEILIQAAQGQNALTFTITDKGKAFDPTAQKEANITTSLENRPVGGLGIHLVRKIMDHVRYERRNGKNVLILTKNYEYNGSQN